MVASAWNLPGILPRPGLQQQKQLRHELREFRENSNDRRG
jgi:hypothetical protein